MVVTGGRSREAAIEFPDHPEMRVSQETIYQSLFVQGRGELRKELVRCLRSGRPDAASSAGERPGRAGSRTW